MAAETEVEQIDHLISIATFDGIIDSLKEYKKKIEKKTQKDDNEPIIDKIEKVEDTHVKKESPNVTSIPAVVPDLGLTYVPIENFAWDQGEYNSPVLTIYVDLPGVQKDKVQCNFTSESFDLKVLDFNARNFRLVKDNLEHDIIPGESKFIVKKDKIILKLKKVKGEYSYENWSKLVSNKPRSERDAKKKDPSAGLMDMMKDMYNDGDDNMRKVIGEAMLKSQQERLEKGGL